MIALNCGCTSFGVTPAFSRTNGVPPRPRRAAGNPDVGVDWRRCVWRQHADDGVLLIADRNVRISDRGPIPELLLPEVIADERDALSVHLIRRRKPAQARMRAEQLEESVAGRCDFDFHD